MSILTVVGIGNHLYCDDGIGCDVVQRLSDKNMDRRVEYLVGETDIAYCVSNIYTPHVIIVDAVKADREPGSVSLYQPEEFLTCLRHGVSMHNLHLLSFLAIIEETDIKIIGIEPFELSLHSGFSSKMNLSLKKIINDVSDIIRDISEKIMV